MRRRFIMLMLCAALGAAMENENLGLAQGIDRQSQSGSALAAVLRHADDFENYNLKVGPVTLRADAYVPFSFNDNTSLVKTGRIADLIITPTLGLHARWKVTDLNTLTLDLGIGYQMYTFNSQYNNIVLAPNSQASFNFFVGNVAINVHDIFSYQQDPTEIGQLSNQTRLARFTNDVGFSATWDLNAFILSLSYDHSNFWVTQNAYKYLTNQSDTVAPKVTFVINKQIKAGISSSFGHTAYEESFENDYTTESAGPFVTAQFSQNLAVQAQVGGYFSQYAHGGGNRDNSDTASYYASAGVTHQINEFMTESLTFGREFIPGLTSNFTQRVYATYGNTWRATKTIDLGGSLWWENLDDSDSAFRQTSDRYGVGFNVNDYLTQNLTLNFEYQYTLKESDPSTLSYYQNVATFGIRYNF